MKKIAIIAPCILPVPASKGGAVEELITCILNQNEISKQFAIDLYTIADTSYPNTSYNLTKIIPISINSIASKFDKVTDKLYRTLNKYDSKRLMDDAIIASFLANEKNLEEPYYAVIVQNLMSIAAKLVQAKSGGREYPIFLHMHNDVDIYRSPFYINMLTDAGVQFIAISEYIKSQILKYNKNAVVHLLYNGVDFSSYTMTTRQPDGSTKFLYAGRIIPAKGVLELVEAFNIMLKKLPDASDFTLDIIGFSDNPYAYEKKVMALAAESNGRVNCLPRIATTEMMQRYNEYDVVVMPTMNEEPFGLVALETIAKGIPLITTNSGAIPEVVGDGAVIVDKNHDFIDGLATAMVDFYHNPNKRIECGKKGYSLARNRVEFNIDYYYHMLMGFLVNNNQNEKVSIIVPVYNVENYVARCIETLINQTYDNLEIILVDDESKDSSGEICEEYAKRDSRIKVIHQKNMGLSGARNSGIDMSTGGYIFFVDSDDYIALDTIEKMMAHSRRTNADVVACGFAHVFDDDRPEVPVTSKTPGMWSGHNSVIQMMRTNNVCTVAWNKLYKSQLWDGVRYPVGKVHEDEATTYKLLYKAKLVSYMPETFYKYYQRSDSIMVASIVSRSPDFFEAIHNRIQFFDSCGDVELREHARITLLDYCKYVYRNAENPQVKRDLVNKYREEIRQNKLPSVCGLKKKVGQFLWQYYQY